MPEIVGVRFKAVTKVYYFGPGDFRDLAKNDPVIVETMRGEELGWVEIPLKTVPDEEIKGKLKPVVRRANPVDLAQMEEHRRREGQALDRCRQKAAELGLPMKVIRAEYGFDGRRLLFAFTSEQRVDFRELVRVLARSFKTRIEMKQIGARDEAKLIGGYGRCGRELCCSTWLTEFHPVSIKMAKQQDLPLAPSEISGLCGRLLCCLAYENEQYVGFRQSVPKVGTQVVTPQGEGVIVGLNVLTESALVELQNELTVEVKASEVQRVAQGNGSSRSPGQAPRKGRRRKR
jgi:cell fate regulator YaaT (PSP1 superfamily)